MDSIHRLLQSPDLRGTLPTIMKTLIAIAALVAVTLAMPVQARDYVVELLIFAQNNTRDAADEWWPPVGAVGAPKALDLFGGDAALGRTRGFLRSDSHDEALAGARARLMKAGNYRVLTHRTWQQPGLSANAAVPIRIAAGPTIRHTMPTHPNANPAAAPRRSARRELEGTVKVSLGRYLHVHTDLVYWRPMPATPTIAAPATQSSTAEPTPPNTVAPTAAAPAPRLTGFRLRQHRRMRSRELHYLDHPMLGLIIIINRA